LLARPVRALHAAIRLIAQPLSTPGRMGLRPARPVATNVC
jgi:hypothetical protein